MASKHQSLEEKAAVRVDIAKSVTTQLKAGVDVMTAVATTARKFGCTEQWVRSSCRENQVKLPRGPMGSPGGPRNPTTSFAVLARLLKGETESEIAKKLDISRQRVNQVKQEADRHKIFELCRR